MTKNLNRTMYWLFAINTLVLLYNLYVSIDKGSWNGVGGYLTALIWFGNYVFLWHTSQKRIESVMKGWGQCVDTLKEISDKVSKI